MFDNNNLLNLNEEYSFEVKVQDQERTLAGKLFLSPKECTLHVMTERQPSDEFYNSEVILCSTLNKSFTLFGLACNHSSVMYHLTEGEDFNIGFYEYTFHIQFLIISNGFLNFDDQLINFTFNAPILKKWVGYTKTQNNLINKIIKNEKINTEDLIEFTTHIDNHAQLVLHYELTQHFGGDLFSVGSNFPPKLTINFNSVKSISELHIELNKIYELMTLIIGSDFKIDIIEAQQSGSPFSKSSIYFPTSNRGKEVDYPLLPLGHDLVNPFFGYEVLPLDYFNNFYNLSDETRTLFTNYLRYKRMKSNEEKFLGFFRLLEKLTFKSQSYVDEYILKSILTKSRSYLKNRLGCRTKVIKDFSSRIEGTNRMKYNTLKCLGDFHDTLPIEISNKLIYKKVDLERIIKLRNDITHANHYTIDDNDLYRFTIFINSLLVLAFINKLKIPYKVCVPINLNSFLPHN
ncbi:TPA: hypothetical protein JH890_000572 [Acinetobacter baumannii]|nr:hypothetical protein [Acinetobacter baumannii]